MTQMRSTLQTILEEIQTTANETPHVYFEPPETVKMSYPCFVYHFTGYNSVNANDDDYLKSEEYAVRYITKKADPPIPKAVAALPHVTYDRHYVAENLHHFMFTFRGMLRHSDPELDIRQIASSFLGGNNG